MLEYFHEPLYNQGIRWLVQTFRDITPRAITRLAMSVQLYGEFIA